MTSPVDFASAFGSTPLACPLDAKCTGALVPAELDIARRKTVTIDRVYMSVCQHASCKPPRWRSVLDAETGPNSADG